MKFESEVLIPHLDSSSAEHILAPKVPAPPAAPLQVDASFDLVKPVPLFEGSCVTPTVPYFEQSCASPTAHVTVSASISQFEDFPSFPSADFDFDLDFPGPGELPPAPEPSVFDFPQEVSDSLPHLVNTSFKPAYIPFSPPAEPLRNYKPPLSTQDTSVVLAQIQEDLCYTFQALNQSFRRHSFNLKRDLFTNLVKG